MMIKLLPISILLCLLLMSSCREGDKNRTDVIPNELINDTIINGKGKTISESVLQNLFYSDEYKKIVFGGYRFDSERKIGLYISALIDVNEYSMASHIVQRYQPESYFLTSTGINVPIYSKSIDEYLLYSLLKYYQFAMGLEPEDNVEMYLKNVYNQELQKYDVRLRDYFKIEYLFNDYLSNIALQRNKKKYLMN